MLVRDLCRVYGLRSRLTKQTLMCGFAAGATHPMGGNCKAVCKADNARASSHELPPVSRRLVRDSDERRQRLEAIGTCEFEADAHSSRVFVSSARRPW